VASRGFRSSDEQLFANADIELQKFPSDEEKAMVVKHKVTVSIGRPTYRPTATQRRAASVAALASQQENLKREAAERRAKRARDEARPGHDLPQSTLG
jgi:hypothetical protein